MFTFTSIKRSSVLSLIAAAVMLAAVLVATQEIAKANAPACDGLACTSASDCGTKCFCNTPSQKCYVD